MLSAEQIEQNYKTFRETITKFFPTRIANLNAMYDEFDLDARLMTAPASSVEHYHNAFPGGYVDHVLRVVDFSIKEYKYWKADGLMVDNFTLEELVFAAFHHDLGKIGLPGEGLVSYVINESEWHRKNQGKMYMHNSDVPFALVPDISLFLLQHFGITYTWQEFLAIRTHDGLYDEANKAYFFSKSLDTRPKTNINQILHVADYKAARFEFERWALKSGKFNFWNGEKVQPAKKILQETFKADNAKQAFDKAFGELVK